MRHFTTVCLRPDGFARGPFGTYKKNAAAVGDNSLDKRIGVASHGQALLKVNDVDLVALAENVRCHFRVPVAGLMTKVHASLKHLAHRYVCHIISPG